MLLLSIGFPEGSPEPELIRQKVSKMTGLNIILNHNQDDDVYDLSHAEFRRPCMFEITEKVVSLLLFLASYSYLEWMTIAALVELGGIYKGKLPWFVNIKWHERKWWYFLQK